jgi:hypothetical protein
LAVDGRRSLSGHARELTCTDCSKVMISTRLRAATKNQFHVLGGASASDTKNWSDLVPQRGQLNLRIKILDDGLHSRNCLLKRGNLGNLKIGYRTVAPSEGHYQFATLFLELHERQTVIFKIFHMALLSPYRHSSEHL